MQTNGMSEILGQAEKDFAPEVKTGESAELGKESFLELLVTQLEHQNPLEPTADTEFVAQLAQFSSLEQLTNISESVGNLNQNFGQRDVISAVGFLGKEVLAEGTGVSKEGNDVSSLYYDLDETAAQVYVNIFDAQGNIVRTVETGTKQPGKYQFTWDGKNYAGTEMMDGLYTVAIAAEGVHGEPVLVNTEVSGLVTGLNMEDGTTYLRLKDGREVDINNIKEVVNPETVGEEEA